MLIADDKMHCMKRCELSSVTVTIRARCLLCGCVYSLDYIIGVILQ